MESGGQGGDFPLSQREQGYTPRPPMGPLSMPSPVIVSSEQITVEILLLSLALSRGTARHNRGRWKHLPEWDYQGAVGLGQPRWDMSTHPAQAQCFFYFTLTLDIFASCFIMKY